MKIKEKVEFKVLVTVDRESLDVDVDNCIKDVEEMIREIGVKDKHGKYNVYVTDVLRMLSLVH